MTMLTTAEATKFLTKSDLEKLLKTAEAGKLQGLITNKTAPAPEIQVRGESVSLFDILSLIGQIK